MRFHKQAFTLIELLLVIMIISMLATALLRAYSSNLRIARVQVSAELIVALLEEYRTSARAVLKNVSEGSISAGCFGIRFTISDFDKEELKIVTPQFSPKLSYKCELTEEGAVFPWKFPRGVGISKIALFDKITRQPLTTDLSHLVVLFLPPDGTLLFWLPEMPNADDNPLYGVTREQIVQAEITVSYGSETDPDSAFTKLIVIDGLSAGVSIL